MPDLVTAPETLAEATPSATLAPTTPAAPAPVATPQVPEGYVPSYRLREQSEAHRTAQQAWAAKEAEYKANYEAVQRQLHAVVGVTPQGDPDIEAVHQQFGGLYPGLSKLEPLAEELAALLGRSGDWEAQNQHYWQGYGRQSMDRLFEKASQTYGSALSDEGKRALHSAFTGYVSSSPELSTRYASDPSVVDEFWKYFTTNFIDPARRAATAIVVGRTEGVLPKDTPGGPPRATPAPQLQNLDERAAAAWHQYETTAKR